MIRHYAKMILTFLCAQFFCAAEYDPLKVATKAVATQTYEVVDSKNHRTLPIRAYFPESKSPAPVILFSHGLGGSCDNNPYLGNHWARRGYVVIFVQHPGSDESVWKDTPLLQRMTAMKQAASLENFMARSGDIPAVIDSLTTWNQQKGHALFQRLDLQHIGMSGHSFGANTTQAVAGQSFARGRKSFVEPRIDAALMMSPSPPALGDPASAFASIKIPCLLMTGTKDDSPIGNSTAADRLNVFPYLEKAAAWQVVFNDATHMSFGERELTGGAIKNSRYHKAILALSTAFWDAQLRGNADAKAWLNGEGARKVLDPKDTWEANARTK
jgi:predicted dienelactone hydrolase